MMTRRIVLFLFLLAGLRQMGFAGVHDDWQPVSNEQAVAFVEKFYARMSMENGRWDDAVLEQFLAPAVLKTLADSAAASVEQKYASWLLSATDDSEMIKPSVRSKDPVMTADGRVAKEQSVFYWGDTWLRATQTLYFTVKSKGGRLFITRVDGMGGEAAASVWQQLESRNEGREMQDEMPGDNPLQQFGGNIGPYAITLFWNPADFGVGDTVGNYYYNDRPNSVFTLELVVNEAVNDKGSMHVVLKEFTANGNHTGTFDGQYECRGGAFEGTFTTTKGKKYHFELMEK